MTVEDDECLEPGSGINLPISCNSWGFDQLLPLSLESPPPVLIGAGMVAPLTDDSPRRVWASAVRTNGQSPTLTAEECLNRSPRLNVAFEAEPG